MRKLLLSVVLLLGCGDPAGPDDLLYVTKVSPTVLRVGELAAVTTTVVNVGELDREVPAPGNCTRVFVVTREDGSLLVPRGVQCLSYTSTTVRGGEVMVFNETWKPSEAGTYLLRSSVGFAGGAREGSPARVEVRP